ncbi:MAG: transglutaminase family protein [Candidatus Nanopelagicales bacterium]
MAGRRLRITHRTGYRYAAPVVASFNEVRMTPCDADGQMLLSHQLQISPRASVQAYVDYWGALVQSFDVHEEHEMLEIVASSLVDVPYGHPTAQGLDWRGLRDGSVLDRWGEYLVPTDLVDDARLDEMRGPIIEQLRNLPSPALAVRGAIEAVRDRIRYDDAATGVTTTAAQAWEIGAGVCQDYSHTLLSILRGLGIPARYVSGYLHDEEEQQGRTVVGESHAWVEAWNGGWEAWDPTNDRSVGSAHVVVAKGRDYADVPPLKGIYAGGLSESLGVSVEITQLEA